jgi:hypothetical protein
MTSPRWQHTVDQAIRVGAKEALRRYGMRTASRRGLPDFAIIGSKRGGTTSLYNYLLEHPLITSMFPARQNIKGTHYFDNEYWRGSDWYRSHFPLAPARRKTATGEGTLTGEASPYYLFHPLAASRMAADVPHARLVIILRDPVERAYSHYKERVRHGAETLSFSEALDREAGRLAGEEERILTVPGYTSSEHEDHSYLAQGLYAPMLRRWLAWFPPGNTMVLLSEDFYADPNKIANKVWRFLGLPPHELRDRRRFNYHEAPDLDPEIRLDLARRVVEPNLELAELLHRELPWPSPAARPSAHGSLEPPLPRGAAEGSPATTRRNDRLAPSPPLPPDLGTPWPAVTVVVPTRDRPEMLRRAVRSVLDQRYEGRIECIVVFDQSDPAPVDVEVGENRQLRLERNERTPGLAGARNTGYLLASTAYVANCDDDDEWHRDKLSRQVKCLQASGAELASTGIAIRVGGRAPERVPRPPVDFGRLLRERVTGVHPSTYLVRREAIERGVGLVDEEIPGGFGEDYDWLLRAAWRRPVAIVAAPLVDVHWNERSYFSRDWVTIADALHYLLRRHPELRRTRTGYAWIVGQIAFAEAASGSRRAAVGHAATALSANPLERRAYVALGVASRLVRAETVVSLANRTGHGI